MKKFVTDNPQGNFETGLNFVYSRDGQAYIRADEDGAGIPLTDWMKQQCIRHGCDELEDIKSEEIDEIIGDCAFDYWTCPMFVMYMCACQAVHLRDRLRLYEETGLFPNDVANILSQTKTPTETGGDGWTTAEPIGRERKENESNNENRAILP